MSNPHEFVLLDGQEFCWRCRKTETEIWAGGGRPCEGIICERCPEPDLCAETDCCMLTGEDL